MHLIGMFKGPDILMVKYFASLRVKEVLKSFQKHTVNKPFDQCCQFGDFVTKFSDFLIVAATRNYFGCI